MKGGGSIQMTLVSEYAKKKAAAGQFKGNVIVVGVPDEGKSFGGMRAAVLLLKELKDSMR